MPASLLARSCSLLLVAGTLAHSGLAAQTQPVGTPIVPRGEVHFSLDGTHRTAERFYDPDTDGRIAFGRGFFLPELGPAQAPGLVEETERLRTLVGDPSAPGVRLGSTVGRMYGEEQSTRFHLAYGWLDRVTVGVTVPLVRRRVDALVRLGPEGANVGANPSATDPTTTALFLQQSLQARADAGVLVNAHCLDLGEDDPECQSGRALLSEADAFLTALDQSWAGGATFPMVASTLGNRLLDRWALIRDGLAGWEATAPEAPPLATAPPSDAALRSLVTGSAWPLDGFPNEDTPAYLRLGDVEVHGHLGLVASDPASTGLRFRSSLSTTVRIATGRPDSLMVVAPSLPRRGVSGVDIALRTDLLPSARTAVLLEIGAGWSGSREVDMVAPDPARVWIPGEARRTVLWEPGGHLFLAVRPRIHLRETLSLGAGWELLKRETDSFGTLGDGDPIPTPEAGVQVQHLTVELRYTALAGPAAASARFPFEVHLRGVRALSGSGERAPVEHRVDAGIRFRLRR